MKNFEILVVGDLILDEYIDGVCERISPEAPVPIVRMTKKYVKLGGAGNVAIGISKLGAKTGLIGTVGLDENGTILRDLLESDAIDCDLVTDQFNRTNKKTRVQVDGHQLLRVDDEPIFLNTGGEVYNKLRAWLHKAKIVVLSDYNKGNLSQSQKIIELCKAQNKISIVDPKLADWNNYAGCSIITPNSKEFTAACEFEGLAGNSTKCCADELIKRHQIDAILLTLGSDGMKLYRKNTRVFDVPSVAQEVFDVTGAGDTTVAVLAKLIADGKNIEDAVNMANTAAGITVNKIGSYAVSLNEIDSALKSSKYVDVNTLVKKINELRKSSDVKIGFTNGCFDILHNGHIRYLHECKKHSDFLIVAVNSDQSVAKLKGDDRPIIHEKDRCEMLCALSMVDFVTCFDNETPEELIRMLKPDVLLKGGDYNVAEIIGSDDVISSGGKVQVVTYHDRYSTTFLIDKIRGAAL